MYIYISGFGSGIGKSTISMGLFESLLNNGYIADELCFIKPITQCLDIEPVVKYCKIKGITNIPIGSVVFEKGYTSMFTNNKNSSESELLEKVINQIMQVSIDKKITIIDGIGYPSVGRIVGVQSDKIIKKIKPYLITVVEGSLGNAIDSLYLLEGYYKSKNINIDACFVNQIPEDTYSTMCSDIKKAYDKIFPNIKLLGIIKEYNKITYNNLEYLDFFKSNVKLD